MYDGIILARGEPMPRAWLLAAAALLTSACSSSGSDVTSDDPGSDTQEIVSGGRACTQDSDCSHGVAGLGVICVRSGANRGTCGDGCHSDDDCPGGGSCDKTTAHWHCDDALPKLGTACGDDAFCAGNDTEGSDQYGVAYDDSGDDDSETLSGVGRVCSTKTHRCIIGCHADTDCPSGSACDMKRSTPVCVGPGAQGGLDTGDDDDPTADNPPPKPGECAPITYPSGVAIVTVADPDLTAKYASLHATSCTVPVCFLDLEDLRSPDGTELDVDVQLSDHFTLREIVRTEIDGSFSKRVLVDRVFVEKLEALRVAAGEEVTLNSAFRSPEHQEATCQSVCGCAQCVSDGRGGNRCGNAGGKVTCAKNSRHMWGAAADMSLGFSGAARKAGFPFVFEEFGGSGPHLHVDMKECR
jgi:hypothetical protein